MPRIKKRVPMSPWTFRITCEYENIQPVVELITDKELTSGTYVLGYETTSRDGSPAQPHFHGYFETIMTQQQIRDSFRDLGFSSKYQLSPPKSGNFLCPTACAYCIKYGKYQTANIDEGLIQAWNDHNERLVQEFKNNKAIKKAKTKSFYRKVEEHFESKWIDLQEVDRYGIDRATMEMVHDLVEYCIEDDVPIRRSTILYMVQSFMCKYCPSYKANFVANLARDCYQL